MQRLSDLQEQGSSKNKPKEYNTTETIPNENSSIKDESSATNSDAIFVQANTDRSQEEGRVVLMDEEVDDQ